jgi:hypothetical protein
MGSSSVQTVSLKWSEFGQPALTCSGHCHKEVVKAGQIEGLLGPSYEALQVALVNAADGYDIVTPCRKCIY